MPTIAELQIAVDSSPLEQGTKALNDFSVAAEKASKATKQKTESDSKAQAANKAVAEANESTTVSVTKQAKELESLIGKLDPVTKKLNDLAKQEATLFANKGNLPVAQFEQYNKILEDSFNKLLGVSTAQKQVDQTNEGIPDRLLKIGAAAVDAANAQERLTNAFRGASEAEQGLVSSGAVEASKRRADAALDEFNARRLATEASREAGTALKAEAVDIGALSSKIDPTVKKLAELKDMQQQLNKAYLEGGFAGNEAEFRRLNGVLDRQREAYKRLNSELSNTGKTAKELAFAMRGLPAQFTDIVVSLQGGQAPLTVLLQQGGQIKDMFGGIVPALRAMGTALVGMINPATITAAALATLAIASYKGSQELTDFTKSIILSNNAAGVSASQFAAYRNVLSDTTTTAGKASEALTLLAGGGRVLGDQFVKVADAAILFQKATGQALSETISDFNAIGKDPVEAAVRLDEKYKFLTSSILAQAEAMVRAGQETEAAAFLQDKMAEATTVAATKVIDQAGLMEKAWRGVTWAVTGTWDALKQIGRESTSTDELKFLQGQLEALEVRQRNSTRFLGGLGGSGIQKEIDDQKALIKQKQLRIDYEKLLADNEAKGEDARRDAVEAQVSSMRRYTSAMKGVEKATEELRKVRLENEKINAGGGVTDQQRIVMTRNEQRAVEELEKAKAKEGKTKSTPVDTRQVTEVRNNLTQITAEYEGYYKKVTALGKANIVSEEATYNSQKAILEAQKKAVAASYDDQISAIEKLRNNKKNSKSQNISLDNQMSKAETDRVVALEKIETRMEELQSREKGRLDKRTSNISAYKAALDAQLDSLKEEGARAVDGVGRGDNASAVAKQLASNDRSFDKQQRALAKSLGEGMDPVEYAEKLKDLQTAHTDMTDQIIRNNEDIQASNRDWTNGFTRAVENAAEDGRNFARTTEQIVSGAFNSMGDALATFVTTGKLNFKSLASSILADMARIAAKQAASSALSSLFGMVATAYGGWGGAASSALSSASTSGAAAGATNFGSGVSPNVTPTVQFPQAKGGAWDSGTKFFAKGGAFTNSIVSSATSFGMSNGGQGVMGEAGPEAIIPLARTSDGSLGVRMVGSDGQSGGVNVYITIAGDGQTTSDSDDDNYTGFGREIGDFVDSRYRVLMDRDLRAGGSLARAIKEQ